MEPIESGLNSKTRNGSYVHAVQFIHILESQYMYLKENKVNLQIYEGTEFNSKKIFIKRKKIQVLI